MQPPAPPPPLTPAMPVVPPRPAAPVVPALPVVPPFPAVPVAVDPAEPVVPALAPPVAPAPVVPALPPVPAAPDVPALPDDEPPAPDGWTSVDPAHAAIVSSASKDEVLHKRRVIGGTSTGCDQRGGGPYSESRYSE